jgi:hypothetical protein
MEESLGNGTKLCGSHANNYMTAILATDGAFWLGWAGLENIHLFLHAFQMSGLAIFPSSHVLSGYLPT